MTTLTELEALEEEYKAAFAALRGLRETHRQEREDLERRQYEQAQAIQGRCVRLKVKIRQAQADLIPWPDTRKS